MLRGGLARVAPLLQHPRYEVFPAASTEDAVLEWVPSDITVTVTASPAKGLDPTLDLAERLTARGYQVVPHLSARLVRDEAHLADIVARLTAGGLPPARPEQLGPRSRVPVPGGVVDEALSGVRRPGSPSRA